MISGRLMSGAVAVLLVVASPRLAGAEPFNVRGYTQGMSQAQVEEVARRSGHQARKQVDQGSATILQGDAQLLELSFCNDRLFYAYWTVHGGLDRFVKQLDELTRQGLEKADVSWHSTFGYNNKEYYDLKVNFSRPGSENDYVVHATLFASEQHGTTNSQVTYTAFSAEYCSGRQSLDSTQ